MFSWKMLDNLSNRKEIEVEQETEHASNFHTQKVAATLHWPARPITRGSAPRLSSSNRGICTLHNGTILYILSSQKTCKSSSKDIEYYIMDHELWIYVCTFEGYTRMVVVLRHSCIFIVDTLFMKRKRKPDFQINFIAAHLRNYVE